MIPGVKISRLLKSLEPKDQEDLGLMRTLVSVAQLMLRGAHIDLSLSGSTVLQMQNKSLPNMDCDVQKFVGYLSEDSKHYLHGLVEAVDIYQSIHGSPLVVQRLNLGNDDLHELRQIRDLCLQDTLRSIY